MTQKYKEALERAQIWQKHLYEVGDKDYADELNYIFPELKESEDEKIRNLIINHLTQERGSLSSTEAADAIAWLEKQEGCEHIKKEWLEHIKQSWYKEGFIDGKYSGGTSKEWTINDTTTLNELIDFLENGTAKLQHDLTRYANWLKIQFTPIEKQGDQKPADTVEPKFKVGDWVISTLPGIKYPHLITDIQDGYYILGEDDDYAHIASNDDVLKLWTIQDAKDGDVLCTYECDEPKIVFILKGTPKKHYALSYHCYYNIMYPHFASDSEKGCLAPNDKDVKPATKEQRDSLLKAIADAGYTIDFDKKELKKVEQKSTQWNISDFRTWQHIVSDILTKYQGIGQYLDGSEYRKIAKYMQEEWSKKLCLNQKPATIDIDKMVDDYANNKERGNEEFGKPVPCMVRAYRQGLSDAIGKVVLKPAWIKNKK